MSDRSSLSDALQEALATYDRRRAVDLAVGALDDGSVSIEDLYRVLSDILVQVGADWQQGKIEVWQEHFVTGVVRNIVEACIQRVQEAAPKELRATIVLAAPTDEYHDLGLRMLGDRFTLAGWRVHFLGAHVPVSELVSAVDELGADAVGLSASTHFHRARLGEYVATLNERHPRVRVWVGGPAFAYEHGEWAEDMILDPRDDPRAETELMLTFSIAVRFLRSSLGQTSLIVAGIGVGIAVVIFVGSLISSLQNDLIDSTVGSSPQIVLLPEDDGTISASLAQTAADDPEVTTAIPVRRMSAIHSQGDNSSALSVTGGTLPDLDSVYKLSDSIVAGEYSFDGGEILVGVGFSESTETGAGDAVNLILPDGTMEEYTVAGVFDLGAAAANDRVAFLDPDSAASALGLAEDEYSAIEIQVDDVFASSEVAERLATDGVTVVDWQDENEELLSGLAAQSGSSIMIQTFVLVAVALGIASTLAISAAQKTRQIGILKAMGMSDASAGRIFLLQAAILGVVGVAVGIAVGYVLIWGFSLAPVEFSVSPSPTLIVVSALVGIGVALLSSIVPSRATSRLDPIEVIQGG